MASGEPSDGMALGKRGLFWLRVLSVIFLGSIVFFGTGSLLIGIPAILRFGGWGLLAACIAAPVFTHVAIERIKPRRPAEILLNFGVSTVGLFGIAVWLLLRGEFFAGLGAAYISILLPAIVYWPSTWRFHADEKRHRAFVARFKDGPIGFWQAIDEDPTVCRILFQRDGNGVYWIRSKLDGAISDPVRFEWRFENESEISVRSADAAAGWLTLNWHFAYAEGRAPVYPDQTVFTALHRKADNEADAAKKTVVGFDRTKEQSEEEWNAAWIAEEIQFLSRCWPGPHRIYYCCEPDVGLPGIDQKPVVEK